MPAAGEIFFASRRQIFQQAGGRQIYGGFACGRQNLHIYVTCGLPKVPAFPTLIKVLNESNFHTPAYFLEIFEDFVKGILDPCKGSFTNILVLKQELVHEN